MSRRPLGFEEARRILRERGLRGWRLSRGKILRISKRYVLEDFLQAVNMINRVGDAAENMEHHPDVCIESYNIVKVSLMTHEARGLTEKDFQLAAEIEKIYSDLKKATPGKG